MNKVDVSVIIVSFNTKKLTINCIKSVIKDTSNLTKEIIVVDNGSSDGSIDAVRKLSKSLKKNKPLTRIKIIDNKINLGFAKANNKALSKAKGKYYLLLNSDCEIERGAILKLVELAKNEISVGAVVPRLLNPDGSIQPSVFRLPTLGRAVRQYWMGDKGLLDKYYPTGVKPSRVEAAVMAAFLIPRKTIRKIGKLDERYFMYFEDLDYCKRIMASGLKTYYHPQAEVVHVHGASGAGLTKPEDQWRRLIPSSKIFHGPIQHYLYNFILWSGQKWLKLHR